VPRGVSKPIERLPFAPIAQLYPEQSLRGLADMFGVTWTAVRAWADRGVPVHRADHLAVNCLGLHPASVWGDAWWALTPIED
jgi:hypothetical protein